MARHLTKRFSIPVTILTWVGAAVLYYLFFSSLLDTPYNFRLRHSSDLMKDELKVLEQRCDSLESVIANVEERDRNIFAILFESKPYDIASEYGIQRLELHERLIATSDRGLSAQFDEGISCLESRLARLEESYSTIRSRLDSLASRADYIPSIQPVVNPHLTLLTASYGMLMHPFYRTLQSHQGVDYTVPEGTRVFATADGTVRSISSSSSTSGLTLVIDHGNGYTTSYAHLGSTKVRNGEKVHRGDIVALSGNTGLSLSPHLHYEVRYDGIRVDPIHYFFMELTPDEYQQIMRIALSGMQSFD